MEPVAICRTKSAQFSRSSVMCRGSGLSSLRSTRLTISVSTVLARHARPTFAPHETVEEFDLRAPAFLHVLAHGGTLLGGGALAVLEALLVAGVNRRFV